MDSRLKSVFPSFKSFLRNQGMGERDLGVLEKKLEEEMSNVQPPMIAIIGFCGVGKSSTLNALFNAGCPTSDVRACTQEATPVLATLEQYTGSKGTIQFYDMPGLGEDIKKDPMFKQIYAEILPTVDAIIWTFTANDRVMSPMQEALIELQERIGSDFCDRLLFAINKADIVEPGETAWNTKFNTPSKEQQERLLESEQYLLEKVRQVIPGWEGPIVSYSAKYRYHLEQLMTAMVEVMPKNRAWVLNDIADVADYTELIDSEYLAYIQSMMSNRG